MIIDGKKIAGQIKQEVAEEVKKCVEQGFRKPQLTVILVGENPASKSYVKGKRNDAQEVGFDSETIHFDESVTEDELVKRIEELNVDPNVDGILVQLPLPAHINANRIIESITADKDVDGFHSENVAALWLKKKGVIACTPKGIIRILRNNGIEIAGKHAVVVGRSNIVGLPAAKLLLDHDATVTMTHSKTRRLGELTRQADILVVAAGCQGLIKPDMIKPGAAVIDVGINRDPETGKLHGDVEFEGSRDIAGAITPVPGGVGPLTRACLMENTLECYKNNLKNS